MELFIDFLFKVILPMGLACLVFITCFHTIPMIVRSLSERKGSK